MKHKRSTFADSPKGRIRRTERRAAIARKAGFLIDGLTVRATALALFAAVSISATDGHAATLADQFAAVCKSRAVKSERLQAACLQNKPPKAIKSGLRFANRGFGAEVNAIIRNLHLIEGK